MYNRYIPQPDGSYSRRKVPDPQQNPPSPPQACWKPEPPPCPPPQPQPAPCQPRIRPSCAHPRRPQLQPPRQERKESHHSQGGSVTDFLRQLLPKDFDTGDLLIVLLLLLMAGDCQEEQNTALLTLALYLFM